MVETKTLEATKKNWKDSHGRVPAAYQAGIKGAKNWQQNAIAGEDLYAQKLQETIASKKRARALADVSDDAWKSAALEKGAGRIASGMAAAEGKYGAGMGKVLSVLQGISLPARTADPAANVENRVKPIAVGLHNAFK